MLTPTQAFQVHKWKGNWFLGKSRLNMKYPMKEAQTTGTVKK